MWQCTDLYTGAVHSITENYLQCGESGCKQLFQKLKSHCKRENPPPPDTVNDTD